MLQVGKWVGYFILDVFDVKGKKGVFLESKTERERDKEKERSWIQPLLPGKKLRVVSFWSYLRQPWSDTLGLPNLTTKPPLALEAMVRPANICHYQEDKPISARTRRVDHHISHHRVHEIIIIFFFMQGKRTWAQRRRTEEEKEWENGLWVVHLAKTNPIIREGLMMLLGLYTVIEKPREQRAGWQRDRNVMLSWGGASPFWGFTSWFTDVKP